MISFLALLSHLAVVAAQKVVISEINAGAALRSIMPGHSESPFLSATLPTELSPVPSTTTFDSALKSMYSTAFAQFLEKIFKDQQVYDVKILSVNIFDEQIVQRGSKTRSLFGSDENEQEQPTIRTPQRKNSSNGKNNDYNTLAFDAVVSAEHQQTLSNESFRKILIHVSHKFNTHLVNFLKETGDAYFMDLDRVVVDDYEQIMAEMEGLTFSSSETQAVSKSIGGLSGSSLNVASIIAIVVGGIAFVVLAFASVKFYRKEQELKRNRWRSKEIASTQADSSMINSLKVLYKKPHHPDDDYSFNPLGTDNGYTGFLSQPHNHSNANNTRNSNRVSNSATGQHQYPSQSGYSDVPMNNNQDGEIAFSSVWPQSAPLFPPPPNLSLGARMDEINDPIKPVTRKHCYAPPGKIGVAIDVINGQPVVHKVKKGSPLEGLLQPMDIVVAIDDVDTSCMSAADVTHLMVKRMNYRRKITFIRGQ